MLVNCPVDTMPASSRPQSSAYLTNARPIKCQGKWHLALVEQLAFAHLGPSKKASNCLLMN